MTNTLLSDRTKQSSVYLLGCIKWNQACKLRQAQCAAHHMLYLMQKSVSFT